MEIQIKKAIKAGNSSAVILPRSWLGKEIRVEIVNKTPQKILSEVIEILNKHMALEEVVGIYLVGSYAREDNDENSDIDILVLTNKINKELIIEGIYSILIVSIELLNKKLQNNLFPLGQMIKEAKPLINSTYLNSINPEVTKKNVKWYIDTTYEKLEIVEEAINELKKRNKEKINDRVLYTLILRIRTLYLIEKLIKNSKYSKSNFIKLIKKISQGNNAYSSYLNVKNNVNEQNLTSLDEAEKLYTYLSKYLEKVESMLRK